MRVFAYVRRGACVSVSILALGATGAFAQQAPQSNTEAQQAAPATTEPAKESHTVKPVEPAASGAEAAAPPGTSTLPELVVDGDKKKKEKKAAAKTKDKAASSAATTEAATTEPPPPGVILGSSSLSDSGTTTFDASNVQLRSNGAGDANSFLRNLPKVQYQNQGYSNGGLSSQKIIDSKPAEISISGGRTYENNFIVNGVSVNNILGSAERGTALNDRATNPQPNTLYGASSQSVYVPSEFVGSATVIDSNASAEYSGFMGGVVLYDLAAPPTDRYRASVSVGRETSDTANYMLVGPNTFNQAPPTFTKNNLAVSVGAPITSDFAFIAQASRKEAEATKPKSPQRGPGVLDDNSDNIFLRFAATAKTEIGKFTLDTNHTKYFNHWEQYQGLNVYLDTNTNNSSTKLEYDTKLPGLRVDAVGLGGVKFKATTYYNTQETQNNSDGNKLFYWSKQRFYDEGAAMYGKTPGAEYFNATENTSWCPGVDPNLWPDKPATWEMDVACNTGGFGNYMQSQDDAGLKASLSGDILLGTFKIGGEAKRYEVERGRAADFISSTSSTVLYTDPFGQRRTSDSIYSYFLGDPAVNFTEFTCGSYEFCNKEQFVQSQQLFRKYAANLTLDAFDTYAQIDQTWKWINVRAGVAHDYDSFMQRNNIAPRFAGTVKPFDGLSITAGYNRYFSAESLYYAIRSKIPNQINIPWTYDPNTGVVYQSGSPTGTQGEYRTDGLRTPYRDEYTVAGVIKDPFLNGTLRLGYMERYGRDQFATTNTCAGMTNSQAVQRGCYTANNNAWDFYRSASAEYTKQWFNLQNAFNLSALSLSGNFTWQREKRSRNNYLVNNDANGDGTSESRIWYNGKSYLAEDFGGLTGNLDTPVRFGASLATSWFNDILQLNLNAGVNLGYAGVWNTLSPRRFPIAPGSSTQALHDVYIDRDFRTTLLLDVSGRVKVTDQASINFRIDNITNSTQNAMVMSAIDNPWVLGRSYWIGSALNF